MHQPLLASNFQTPAVTKASHFVIMMVKKYPFCRIVNFDKLDYCSCIKNLDGIKESPNYK